MITKIYKKIILTAMATLVAIAANAYDFSAVNSDGVTIYYNIESNSTCGVTYSEYCYSGVVNIPSSVRYNGKEYRVTEILLSAFQNCHNLTDITIPNSVEKIGNVPFGGCSNLTSINVESNNEWYSSVDGVLFTKDKSVLITYPQSKEGINYTIPNSVTNIGDFAFAGCSNLNSVLISSFVTDIGFCAFIDCARLTSINVDSNNKNYFSADGILYRREDSVHSYLMQYPKCKNDRSYTIPNFVTRINDGALYGCSGLTSVTIPNSVEYIGNQAFEECTGLTSLAIPNSVTEIGDRAFWGCSGLTSVTIPSSVNFIGSGAFWFCVKLNEVHCLATTPPFLYYSNTFSAEKLYVPETSLELYRSDRCWSFHFSTILSIEDYEADKFKTDNASILSKTTSTVASSDIAAIQKALEDYSTLSQSAKNKLTNGEKALLDALKTKAEELKAEEDIATYACDFSVKDIGGSMNSAVDISVSMDNETAISAFECQFVLPDGLEFLKDKDGDYNFSLGSRASTSHSIMSNLTAKGVVKVASYSSNSTTFTGSNGELFTGKLLLTGKPGTYEVLVKNILLSTSKGTERSCSDVKFNVTITETFTFSVDNINDVQNKTVKMPVSLSNASSVSAFECEIELPDGIDFCRTTSGDVDVTFSGRETNTHSLLSNLLSNKKVKIVSYSSQSKAFAGNTGELFAVNIQLNGAPGDYNVNIKNISVISETGIEYECADVRAKVTIQEPTTPDDSDVEESTDVSKYPIALYINDVESRAGDLNLELNMKCEEENITAYQCDVYLPEGVTWKYTTDKRGKVIYDLPTFNEDRTDDSYHTVTPIAKMADGSYSIIVYSMDKEYILDTDGVLMYLPLEISDEMEAGDYNIIMKNIVLTDVDKNQTLISKMVSKLTIPSYKVGDVNGDDLINVTDIVGVIDLMRGEGEGSIREAADVNGDGLINVTDIVGLIDLMRGESNEAKAAFMTEVPSFATMAKGVMAANEDCDKCNLEVIPFTVANGTTASTVKLNLNNPGDEFTAFQCDVYFPEGISWATTVDKRGNVKLTQPTFDAEADRTDATYHTVDAGLNSNGSFNVVVYSLNKELILDEEGAVLDLPFAFDANLKPGVYDITLKNIVLTRQDKSDEKPADYTFSIMVGSPEDNAIALHGDFTADAIQEYNTVLAANTSVASVDLSEAKAVDGTKAITTGNENAVIYVAEGVSVKNTKNVVVGNTCQNLVLNDANDFSAPKSFTAEVVSYDATVSSSLGYKTLVLPYNCAVPSGFEAYKVGSVSGNILSLVQVESITANKPVIQKNAGTASLSATNVTINATAATLNNGKLVGTYTNIPAPVGSYVLQNQGGNVAFYQVVAGKQPVVGPFRAYLEASETGAKSTLMIGDGATALLDTKSGALIENVEGVFNAAGVRKANITDGVNIIRTADGEVKKIMK